MTKLSPRQKKVTRLHRISHVLDKAIPIPGTQWRIGLDPILGLIPGGGDTIAGTLSAYIIIESARMGLNQKVIGQMVANVLLDSLVGSVPVVGDVFDVTWKANVRNIELLEHHLNYTPENKKVNRLFLIGLSIVLILIVIGFTLLTLALVTWIWKILTANN
ncbi:hypothetical protein cce_4774 [Crocosphaera subtropica ATCC 51142]|uniref:DUF4112 domain-containing protein n=1 Tax=Crocosphaera subtropica (strain ATCC 51142 / BH68) TaxID=43989 RepID=B1X1W1_CROS5|nr:DUF4112 domain-containing protein [Crocosphaera subtropica]ACB54122.1 hypothetical protein cce_4774 [Crocosphaera subtropica ATCC 51142]